jgi:hypothetical protein
VDCTAGLARDRPPCDLAGDWQNVAECTTRNRIGYIIFWPSEAGMMENTPSIAIPRQPEISSGNTSPEIGDFVYGGGM